MANRITRITTKITGNLDELSNLVCDLKSDHRYEKIRNKHGNFFIVDLMEITPQNSGTKTFFVPHPIRNFYFSNRVKFMVHSAEATFKDKNTGEISANIVCAIGGEKLYSYYEFPSEKRGVYGIIALFSKEKLATVSVHLTSGLSGPSFEFTILERSCEFDKNEKIIIKNEEKGKGTWVKKEEKFHLCPIEYKNALFAGIQKIEDIENKKIEPRYYKYNR